jgi:hypothetical protein
VACARSAVVVAEAAETAARCAISDVS